MNHHSLLSFARNILILQVISSPTFDVSNAENINYVWDLWYNLQWPTSTCRRFVKDVRSLVETGLHSGEHHYIFKKNQENEVMEILVHWGYAITMELHLSTKIKDILSCR